MDQGTSKPLHEPRGAFVRRGRGVRRAASGRHGAGACDLARQGGEFAGVLQGVDWNGGVKIPGFACIYKINPRVLGRFICVYNILHVKKN